MVAVREGKTFAGRYRLTERIGAGGMAEVWRGTDEVLRRAVAVKVIDPGLLDNPVFRVRFRAEARAAAGFSHPRVVTVHDFGEEDGTPYIVMELLDGETLADRLSRGPLPPDEAAAVIGQIAAALAAAHESGLVHRDVKPANVHLTRDGVKVLDFGIAAREQSGPVMGTPAYLAPEQLARRPVTPATDVFALGVVLFEALTGWRPFGDYDQRTAPAPPPLPPDIPAHLADLGARCLAADPAARPTAAAVAAELDPTLGPKPGPKPAVPESSGSAEPRPDTAVLADPGGARRRHRLIAAGGAVAALVAAAVVAVVLVTASGGDRPPAEPVASPSATTTDVAEALTELRRAVDEGAAAGEVRSDVALDFDNLISDLQAKLAAGEPVDVSARVDQLRVKIDQRLREDGLSTNRAGKLREALAGLS